MARISRLVPGFFALFIIVSLMTTAAWGGGEGISPGQTVTAASGDDTVLPPGASQDWWSSVQEQIRQSEYQISWQEGTYLPSLKAAYQAPNRAHNMRTYFTESSVQLVPHTIDTTPAWNLGLTLTGYGYEENSRPVAAAEMAVEENRADYDRGDVAEWYVNTEEGLEQGFTLSAPPSGSAGQGSALVLQLSLSGNLTPALAEQGQAIDFTTPGGVRVLRYADLQVNDAEGELLEASLDIGGDSLSITIDAAAAIYPITIDPLLTTPSWMGEGNQANGCYGWSVATAGDVNGDGYSDVIVGAPLNEGTESNEGMAYLYLGSSTGLGTDAAWTAESNQADAHFGYSVATAGDVNGDSYADVIIGARYYTGLISPEALEGAVFVWYGSSTGLGANGTPANADWTAESDQANANFGCSVGTAGDTNGDGCSDIIVGASWYDWTAGDEGAVFVWYGSSTGLGANGTPANANWTAQGNESLGFFGSSVATAGDVNGDGYADVIIGAAGGGNLDGAFVWYGASTGLNGGIDGTLANAGWRADSDQDDSVLGGSVGTAGDVNGDGYADVIVGARLYDNGQIDEGAAFVWYGSSTGLGANGTPANADWRAEGNQASAQFGSSVGTAGDVDGDGYADVIIGARYYTNGQTSEGAAAVYRGSAVGLLPTSGTPATPADADWTAERNQASAAFGHSAGTAGDVNGDGYSDIIIGAYYYDAPTTDEGAAIVYNGYASGLMASWLWAGQSDQVSANFGFSVGTAGDVNGDGYADVIVGAFQYDGGEANEGRVYVFHGSATGLTASAASTLECNMASAQFGYSVGTAGDVNGDGYDDVIIGANQYYSSDAEGGEGAAYLYYGSAGGLEAIYGWMIEGNMFAAQVGHSVGTAGDVNGDGYADVMVGAPYYDATYDEEGRAYVFHGSAAGLATTPSWTVDGGQEKANFGCCVSTAGDVNRDGYTDVIVGAYNFSNGELHEGKAFVYHGSAGGLSTTPAWTKEGNQAGAQFGRAVSTAGDVNGDGYADVIIGSWAFDNGETDEGAVWVYQGSSDGLGTISSWFAESDTASAHFGQSVDTAGDVNGDGYADVIIGAYYYGATHEGAAVLWHGSSAGLGASGTPTNADWGVEGNQDGAYFGHSVASAGDVNGDGYADVIVGAYLWDVNDGSPTEEIVDAGGAVLYYGGGRRGVNLNPRQLRVDNSAPVAHLGISDEPDTIRISILQHTPFGRGKARPQFEVKPLGTPFNGSGLRESSTWVITGGMYSYPVDGLSGHTVYHWRVRLHYNPATTPFQQYSRWFTVPCNGWQEADLRTSNTPPVAVDDSSYSTNEDTALTVAAPGVLGNDSDADGDPLTALKLTEPSHGTVTLNSNGSFTYTPAANYNGSDSFTYKANDGRDDSNTVTVTINVRPVNDAPSFTKGTDQTVAEDTGAQSVSGWATSISAGLSDESTQTVDFIVSNDKNSLFAVQPAISPTGTLTYTPAANANGSAIVTVRIHDNGGTADGGVDTSAAQTFTITITAVNDAPTATGDAYSTHRDTTLNVAAPGVLANDTDIDGGTLTAVLVSNVSHGTLTLNADGSFSYTAESSFAGADSFTYKVNDGTGDSAAVTVAIQVALPEPPMITSITKSSGHRGSTQTVTITGTNLDGLIELYFGEGIAVSNPVAGSPSEITAEITITSDAAVGARDVRVTTPEGTYTLEDGFTVAKAKSGGIPIWVWILVAVVVIAACAVGIVFWCKRKQKAEAP